MTKNVLIVIADGIEEIEAVCIIDILRRAGSIVTVASVDDLQVTASRGTRLVADKSIKDCTNITYDLIALPGGMPGAEHLRDSTDLTSMLKKQAAANRLYAAICASPVVVLHHHGLIGKRKAVCYPSMADELPCPASPDLSTVRDGPCITGRGPGTAINFALKLVEALHGKQKTDELSRQMACQ